MSASIVASRRAPRAARGVEACAKSRLAASPVTSSFVRALITVETSTLNGERLRRAISVTEGARSPRTAFRTAGTMRRSVAVAARFPRGNHSALGSFNSRRHSIYAPSTRSHGRRSTQIPTG